MNPADEYAIVAQNLGVKYDLRLKRRRTLRHSASQLLRGNAVSLGRDEFWALSDVSFALRRGEMLHVIGHNGAGKSTLLETIARVLRPDAGALTTFERSATLLTVGAGFERDLTGRENIYLNAAYLGFSKDQLEARFDDIVDFSELGEFIEAPVSTYSSGMRSRLGFSIAVHLEPQILLLDEVLGAGDGGFKRKSRQKLAELMDRADAIVVVSHSPSFAEHTATKALWLDRGQVVAFGEAEEVLEEYEKTAELKRGPARARRDRELAAPAASGG